MPSRSRFWTQTYAQLFQLSPPQSLMNHAPDGRRSTMYVMSCPFTSRACTRYSVCLVKL